MSDLTEAQVKTAHDFTDELFDLIEKHAEIIWEHGIASTHAACVTLVADVGAHHLKLIKETAASYLPSKEREDE